MNQYDFNKLMEKYLAGKCTLQEELFIEEWSKQFSGYASSGINRSEEIQIKRNNWKRLSKILPKHGLVRKLFYRTVAVAAILSGILVGVQFLTNDSTSFDSSPFVQSVGSEAYISYINTEQQTKRIQLFDGTVVELKPNSSLKYPSHSVGNQRNVYLTGEGYFNVKRDEKHPFFVHAGGLITEVLGTSFTVKSLSKTVEVAVVSGRVSVYENGSIKTKSQVILTPNQKAIYLIERRKLLPGIVEAPKVISAEQGFINMIFDEVPLETVVATLEKGFGLKIKIQNAKIKDCLFSGDLNGLPFMEQLDLICKAVNAQHTTIGNSISIEGGDPCH